MSDAEPKYAKKTMGRTVPPTMLDKLKAWLVAHDFPAEEINTTWPQRKVLIPETIYMDANALEAVYRGVCRCATCGHFFPFFTGVEVDDNVYLPDWCALCGEIVVQGDEENLPVMAAPWYGEAETAVLTEVGPWTPPS